MSSIVIPTKAELEGAESLSERLDLVDCCNIVYHDIPYQFSQRSEVVLSHPEAGHLRHAQPKSTGGGKPFLVRARLVVADDIVGLQSTGRRFPARGCNPLAQ